MSINKLSFLEKLQKKLVLRRLKLGDISTFLKIKSEALRNDQDILNLSWDKASIETYKYFPELYQEKKLKEAINPGELLPNLSENVQEKICNEKPNMIINSSPEVKLKFGPNFPNFISRFDKEIQLKIVEQNKELLNKCSKEIQIQAIDENNNLIFYADKNIAEEKLKSDNNPKLWEEYIKNPNQTLENLEIIYSNSSYIQRNKYFAMFFDSRTDEQLKKELLSDKTVLIDCSFVKYCNLETQEKIHEIIRSIPSKQLLKGEYVQNSHTGFNTNYKIFSKEFILKKISELYGEEIANKYKNFLFNIIDKDLDKKSMIISLFLPEKSTIIEKIDSKKVIHFFESYLDINNKEKKSLEDEAYYYNEFYDLIKEAYGKEALEILRLRPGLKFEDIQTLEVFSPEILKNFNKGFIHDLLNYDFGEDEYEIIKIVKSPEDLIIFKDYYSRIASKIGENSLTMKMCITRYKEFKDLLKDAHTHYLTNEQLEKIDEICMWPKNIAKISRIEEVDNIEKMLINKLKIQIESAKKEQEYVDINDIFDTNIRSENILFNYTNPSSEILSQLNSQELNTLESLKDINLSFSSNAFELEKQIKKLQEHDRPISPLFLRKYELLTKIKKYEMQKFQNETITNKEKIEEKVKTGEYGVKKITIDGFEIIDLGTMPVNFAIHDPSMDNSGVNVINIQDDYLSYDGKRGVSTISAGAATSNGRNNEKGGCYVYWNFDNNEIVALKDENDNDAQVFHGKKAIVSHGASDTSLKDYENQKKGIEIAFYRRYRDHKKIEESPEFGGKILPDAIFLTNITPENIQITTKVFGRKIPIICRGKLQTEEDINYITRMIKEMKEVEIFNQKYLTNTDESLKTRK